MPSIETKQAVALHTPGPWYWHTDHVGNVSLRTPDRGNLIVMDFARKGMQGAAPRLAYWKGLPGGLPRERMGGILDGFNADHPDAVLIASAPDLLARNAELVTLATMCNAYLEPIADQLEICHKQPHEAKALRQLLDMARAALTRANSEART